MAGIGDEIDAHALGHLGLGDVIQQHQAADRAVIGAIPHHAQAETAVAAAKTSQFTVFGRLPGHHRFHGIEQRRVAYCQPQITADDPVAEQGAGGRIGGLHQRATGKKRRIV